MFNQMFLINFLLIQPFTAFLSPFFTSNKTKKIFFFSKIIDFSSHNPNANIESNVCLHNFLHFYYFYFFSEIDFDAQFCFILKYFCRHLFWIFYESIDLRD
ncbi:hypothetical protein ACKWTF_015123 [Chironomus riparius]